MGLIGKLGLIGIVAVAVILAVVWDIHNQSKTVARETSPATQNTAQATLTETSVTAESTVTEAGTVEPGPHPVTPPANPVPSASQPVVGAAVVQPRPTAPAPAAVQKYVTKKGDTLSSIARRFYGDNLKWKAIYEANRQCIPDPNLLPVGMEITIPSVETAEKLAILDLPARATYIVQKDDTLTKIAERHYGDPARWKDIFEANKGKITDKDKVFPGTVLVIPDLSPER